MSTAGSLRKEAVRIFEEFVDSLPDETLREYVSGGRALAFLKVDGRLARLRNGPIEDAYAYLNGLKTGADVKGQLVMASPTGTAKPAWIDHVLLTLFGRTYSPPKPAATAKTTASRKPKKEKPIWNAAEVAKALSNMSSIPEGEAYLKKTGAVKSELQELARLVEAKSTTKDTNPVLREKIIWVTIAGPGTLAQAHKS